MGFPTFYLSDLILIDAGNDDYQCKVNWSPWTRIGISKHNDVKNVIHQKIGLKCVESVLGTLKREECRSYVFENNQKYGSFKNASQGWVRTPVQICRSRVTIFVLIYLKHSDVSTTHFFEISASVRFLLSTLLSLDWSLSQPIKSKKSPVLPLERTYWSIVLLICFIIPIIVLIGSYAGLVLQIVRVQRNIKNMGNSSGKNKSRQLGINEHFRSKSFK